MSASELDISWSMLGQVVRDWAGTSAELCEHSTLAGGSINTTLLLTLRDGRKAVLKITPHRVDRAYADEAHQLELMRQAGVPVPAVYAMHAGSLESPFSYLLMEYVDGVDLNAAKGRCTPEAFDALQRELAETLLRLHATSSTHFMRASRQDVPKFETWAAFYRHVFDAIWHEVEKGNVLPIKPRKCVAKLHDRLDRLLVCDGPPRLLHWDVWATNLLAKPNGDGRWHLSAMLDPNCKFGCPEAELAYLDLFHTATPVFMKTYQQEKKLPAEYHSVRKPIYQLYSLLNHVRLFGNQYEKALCAQVEKVAGLV
jgi:fructosamine-3-kinase